MKAFSRIFNPTSNRTHRPDGEALEGILDVANEQLNEPGAVPPLERQLLVVNDDERHR